MTDDWKELKRLLLEMQRDVRALNERIAQRVKPILTVEEVAELTGRSAYTVRRWVKDGQLTAERVAGGPRGRLLIRRDRLDALLRQARGEKVPEELLATGGSSHD